MTSREYLASCLEQYCSEKDKYKILVRSLPQADIQIQAYLKKHPDAQTFLELQKSFWHNIAIQDLHKDGLLVYHFGNAAYFLYYAEPVIEKHQRLKDRLDEWYYKTLDIAVSGEIIMDLIAWEQPKPLPLIRLMDDRSESSFLESSLEDIAFLDYYKKKAEISWQIYSGLWPYIVEPVEGKTNNNFYAKISDFMLCMIDGIEALSRQMQDTRKQRLN
jgi:hypothetical protein